MEFTIHIRQTNKNIFPKTLEKVKWDMIFRNKIFINFLMHVISDVNFVIRILNIAPIIYETAQENFLPTYKTSCIIFI